MVPSIFDRLLVVEVPGTILGILIDFHVELSSVAARLILTYWKTHGLVAAPAGPLCLVSASAGQASLSV